MLQAQPKSLQLEILAQEETNYTIANYREIPYLTENKNSTAR
jgi:hypothetical protein